MLRAAQGRAAQAERELAVAVGDNRRLASDCLELQQQLRAVGAQAERAQEQASREGRACAELRREVTALRGRAVAQAGMSGKLLQLVGHVVASDARLAPPPAQQQGVDDLVEQLQAFAASRNSQD